MKDALLAASKNEINKAWGPCWGSTACSNYQERGSPKALEKESLHGGWNSNSNDSGTDSSCGAGALDIAVRFGFRALV